jgi:LysM repeat protein
MADPLVASALSEAQNIYLQANRPLGLDIAMPQPAQAGYAETYHKVAPGESLSEIAAQYDKQPGVEVSSKDGQTKGWQAILEANPDKNGSTVLHPGEFLTIPLMQTGGTQKAPELQRPDIHVAAKGENLETIANKLLGPNATTQQVNDLVEKMQDLNGMRGTAVFPGMKVQVPADLMPAEVKTRTALPGDTPISVARELLGPDASPDQVEQLAADIKDMNGQKHDFFYPTQKFKVPVLQAPMPGGYNTNPDPVKMPAEKVINGYEGVQTTLEANAEQLDPPSGEGAKLDQLSGTAGTVVTKGKNSGSANGTVTVATDGTEQGPATVGLQGNANFSVAAGEHVTISGSASGTNTLQDDMKPKSEVSIAATYNNAEGGPITNGRIELKRESDPDGTTTDWVNGNVKLADDELPVTVNGSYRETRMPDGSKSRKAEARAGVDGEYGSAAVEMNDKTGQAMETDLVGTVSVDVPAGKANVNLETKYRAPISGDREDTLTVTGSVYGDDFSLMAKVEGQGGEEAYTIEGDAQISLFGDAGELDLSASYQKKDGYTDASVEAKYKQDPRVNIPVLGSPSIEAAVDGSVSFGPDSPRDEQVSAQVKLDIQDALRIDGFDVTAQGTGSWNNDSGWNGATGKVGGEYPITENLSAYGSAEFIGPGQRQEIGGLKYKLPGNTSVSVEYRDNKGQGPGDTPNQPEGVFFTLQGQY